MNNKKEILKKAGIGISKAILIALFTGLVVVAPGGVAGTLEVINKFLEDREVKEYDKEQLKRALRYLQSKRLIDIQKQYQKEVFGLTRLGYFRAKKLAKSFTIEKPKKWDGKWRIVIFDIPEKKKDTRDVFRQILRNLGFANVQKSIWVYPYECCDQIYYLAENMFIKPYVRYIVAEDITGEKDLRRRFDLT